MPIYDRDYDSPTAPPLPPLPNYPPVAPTTPATNTPPQTGAQPAGTARKADTKPPESLNQAIKRMFAEGWNGRQVHDQIRRWHPGWSEYQIDQVMMRAPKPDKLTPASPNKPKPDNSHSGGWKELESDWHKAVRDVKGAPKGMWRQLEDTALLVGDMPNGRGGSRSIATKAQQEKALRDLRKQDKAMIEVLRHPMRDPFATALLLAALLPGGMKGFSVAEREAAYADAKALLGTRRGEVSLSKLTATQKAELRAIYRDEMSDRKPGVSSTAQHVDLGVKYARALAKELSPVASKNRRANLAENAMVGHDIGKASKERDVVPNKRFPAVAAKKTIEQIITQPRNLTRDERAIMEKHVDRGEAMMREIGIDDPYALAGLKRHHFNAKGTGFPRQNGAPQTKLDTITQAADVFAAMTEKRPYPREDYKGTTKEGQRNIDPKDALDIMKKFMVDRGTLDPKVFGALKKIVEQELRKKKTTPPR